MNQKQIKQKLESLKYPGTLMMLVDFLREEHYDMEVTDEECGREVSKIAAKLRVMYENGIVPVERTKQLDIVEEIEKLSAIGKVKKSKN